MSLDFLKALFSSTPTSADDENNQISYPDSPLDPMKNQKSMLDSMLSPSGIQAPLYNYGQSPEENEIQGSPMALPVPVSADKMTQMNPIAPPAMPQLDNKMRLPASAPTAPGPQMIPPMPEQPVPTPQPMEAPKAPAPAEPDAYDKMLADKRDQMRSLNMLEAADRIGTAIAGEGHLKFEPGKYDNIRKQAEAQSEDFIKGQKYKQEQTKFGLDTEKSKLDIEKARGQADDDKAKRDPNSDISKVNRASVIDNLNKIGRKDLAAQVKPNMSSKQLEDIFGQYNLQNMVTNYEAQQTRRDIARAKAGDKADADKNKQDQKDTERLDKANKMITASIASSRGAFGKTANILRSAEAIETLIKQQPMGQMDNRQIQELARSLDAMLSQGAATITGTAHLVPRSMSGDAAKIQEYISSIPRGAGQAAFVKKMADTVAREKDLARRQIGQESRKMLSSYADLAKKHPESWKLMLQQHDLPEDVFNMENPQDNTTTSHPQFDVDQSALEKEMKKRGL